MEGLSSCRVAQRVRTYREGVRTYQEGVRTYQEGASARPLPPPMRGEATELKSAGAKSQVRQEKATGLLSPSLQTSDRVDIPLTTAAQDTPSWNSGKDRKTSGVQGNFRKVLSPLSLTLGQHMNRENKGLRLNSTRILEGHLPLRETPGHPGEATLTPEHVSHLTHGKRASQPRLPAGADPYGEDHCPGGEPLPPDLGPPSSCLGCGSTCNSAPSEVAPASCLAGGPAPRASSHGQFMSPSLSRLWLEMQLLVVEPSRFQ